jgi:hypothetical protein
MYHKLDADALDYILSPAYMESDVRDLTNAAGFCRMHLTRMATAQNRLGVALMLHTHMKTVAGGMAKAKSAAALLSAQNRRCFVCEKADETFTRYMDTFFYLYAREAEARALTASVTLFCLPHFSEMLEKAERALPKKYLADFTGAVTGIQQRAMAELDGDLDWFIKKFDYRNASEPWGNAKDALPRAAALLRGGS